MVNRQQYSQDELDNYFNINLLRRKRALYLGSINFDNDGRELGIDALAAEYVIKGIEVLNDSSTEAQITVKMNTPGGDALHGWAIYDAIRSSEAPTRIEVYGQALSMGAVILQAGDIRLMHQHATLMIHDGYNEMDRTPVRSSEAWSDWGKKDRMRMYRLFAERSDQTYKYWKDKCANDYIMSANEAYSEGLIDDTIPVRARKRTPSKARAKSKPKVKPKAKAKIKARKKTAAKRRTRRR